MSEQTIHISHMDREVNHVSVVDGSVTDVARLTMLKIRELHSDVRLVRSWYRDGQLVRLQYGHTVSIGAYTAGWQHDFLVPNEQWPMAEYSDLWDVMQP